MKGKSIDQFGENVSLLFTTDDRRCLPVPSADFHSQLDVPGHHSHSAAVDGAVVGVLEEPNYERFCGLLEGSKGAALKPRVRFEFLAYAPDHSLERLFSNEKFRGLLVPPDFLQRDCACSVPVRALDASTHCGSCSFACSFGGELFTGSFSSCGLPCCLLCSCHFTGGVLERIINRKNKPSESGSLPWQPMKTSLAGFFFS